MISENVSLKVKLTLLVNVGKNASILVAVGIIFSIIKFLICSCNLFLIGEGIVWTFGQ